MPPNGSGGLNQGTISTQNIAAPNGNNPTTNSTVAAAYLNGGYDTAVIQVTGTYTGALTVQVQLDGGTWVDLTSGLINVGSGASQGNITSGQVGMFQVDISGFAGIRVTAKAAVTGSAAVTVSPSARNGVVGLDTPVVLGGGTNVIGANGPNANPGQTPFNLNSAATTNATLVKSSAGVLLSLLANNATAAAKYLRLYNKATAPVPGTDTPIAVITLAANTSKEVELGQFGKRFSTGIGYAITNAAGVLDATAVAAGDVQLAGDYT